MAKVKIKPFIFVDSRVYTTIPILKTIKNEYGQSMRFYLIDNHNLETFKTESSFNTYFKNYTANDLEWFLNRWSVSIVTNTYRLNQFFKKDNHLLLNSDNWTTTNVVSKQK